MISLTFNRRSIYNVILIIAAFIILVGICCFEAMQRKSGNGVAVPVNVGTGAEEEEGYIGSDFLKNFESDTAGGNINSGPARDEVAGKQDEGTDFFVEYRLERERVRGKQIELLRELINSSSSTPDLRRQAQEQLLVISNCMGKEMEIEALLKARGFKDVAVNMEKEKVVVIIKTSGSPTVETAEIKSFACQISGLPEEQVIVVSRR